MGTRENAAAQDFSGIPLEEEEESHLKDAAVISMGTEISVEDMMNIEALCDQVLALNPAATCPLPPPSSLHFCTGFSAHVMCASHQMPLTTLGDASFSDWNT